MAHEARVGGKDALLSLASDLSTLVCDHERDASIDAQHRRADGDFRWHLIQSLRESLGSTSWSWIKSKRE
jgi:hypothetical protein